MNKYYELPYDRQRLQKKDLRVADPELQIDIMREWFFQHYQDPVHECPYNGKEGGYLYIHGGPYSAEDELFSEFGGVVEDDVIIRLIDELESECSEWSGFSKPEDYDDYLLDFVGSSDNAFADLEASIQKLRELLSMNLDNPLDQTLFQMIYINSITSLEAFLSEFFIGKIMQNNTYLRSFVESNPDFGREKFSLSEIFKKQEGIKNHVKEYLIDLLWHNLSKLNPMFKKSLGIDFPESMGSLVKATHIRHDLVHRGGKTKSGETIKISKDDLKLLFNEIVAFARHIDNFKPEESEPF